MKDYFITLILVCAVSAVATAISPEGKSKKYVQFLLGVVIMTVLISPFRTVRDLNLSLPDLPDGAVGDTENPIWEATETALREAICSRFGFERGWVGVSVTGELAGEQTVIREVRVTLRGEAGEQRTAVLAYVKAQVRTECEVTVNVG